jgi:phosphotransferase system HPr (HPr) family protein
MREFSITIDDHQQPMRVGPAGEIAQEASRYTSEISMVTEDRRLNARDIFVWMQLRSKAGDVLDFEVTGPDEDKAAESFSAYLKDQLTRA